jgi:hypothetical protein
MVRRWVLWIVPIGWLLIYMRRVFGNQTIVMYRDATHQIVLQPYPTREASHE